MFVSNGFESCLDGRPQLKALKLETNGMLAFFLPPDVWGKPRRMPGEWDTDHWLLVV